MNESEQTTRDEVYEALSMVIDPEIGLDIVTLGLVYDVSIAQDVVDVTFTLTTRGCPMEYPIRSGILEAIGGVPGVRDVQAHLVWQPQWHPGLVKDGAL